MVAVTTKDHLREHKKETRAHQAEGNPAKNPQAGVEQVRIAETGFR